jgi:hypothetical protein
VVLFICIGFLHLSPCRVPLSFFRQSSSVPSNLSLLSRFLSPFLSFWLFRDDWINGSSFRG